MLQSFVPESLNVLISVLREGELLLSCAGFSTGKLQSLLDVRCYVNPAVKLYMNDTVVFVRLLNSCLMIHSKKVNKQYTNITFPSSVMRTPFCSSLAVRFRLQFTLHHPALNRHRRKACQW